jgi:hypothetical protein
MHPAKVANVEILRQRDAYRPGKGHVACGYEGIGRLWRSTKSPALEYKKR